VEPTPRESGNYAYDVHRLADDTNLWFVYVRPSWFSGTRSGIFIVSVAIELSFFAVHKTRVSWDSSVDKSNQ
jgi:hypothetical protein